jgi:hypothetical protein
LVSSSVMKTKSALQNRLEHLSLKSYFSQV